MSSVDFIGDEPIEGFSLPTLYNLVYCSRAVAGVDEAAVDSIIAVAQRHNPINAITGLLVFGSGVFFPVVGGAARSCDQTDEQYRAGHSPRHGCGLE